MYYVVTTNYRAQWNREINHTLSLYLGKPARHIYMRYRRHREWMKESYCPLVEEDKRIFFTNLLDFPCKPRCLEYSGLVHGTRLDLTEPGHDPGAYQYEATLLYGARKVFVPTSYLGEKIKRYYSIKPVVSGFPMDFSRVVEPEEKENIVVWSGRLVKSKGAGDLLDLIPLVLSRRRDIRFIVTFQEFNPVYLGKLRRLKETYEGRLEYYYNLPEKEYFKLLGRAKVIVSTSYHETFGTSIVYGVIHYLYPVVPNRLVYPELYPRKHLYNTLDEAALLIQEFIDSYNPCEIRKLRESLRRNHDYRIVWSRIFGELGVKHSEIDYLSPRTIVDEMALR